MLPLVLQDYILFRSDSGTTTATQDAGSWLDLAGYQDLVAFLEVKEFSGATTIQIAYQTAPTKDDSLFVNMTSAVTLATGLTTTKILKASASVPLARWVRWQLLATGTSGPWGAMFRVWLACNLAGRRGRVSLAADSRSRMLSSEPTPPLSVASPPRIVVGTTNQFPGSNTPFGGFDPATGR